MYQTLTIKSSNLYNLMGFFILSGDKKIKYVLLL